MSSKSLTETDWFRPIDLADALDLARPHLSARRNRLFACACAWLLPEIIDVPLSTRAVVIAERIADGDPLPASEVRWGPERARLGPQIYFNGNWHFHNVAGLLQGHFVLGTCLAALKRITSHPQSVNDLAFLRVLREIVGNPFRPSVLDPHWRTGDVLGLARGIYEDRAFDRMPLLADALMDAGCDDEQVIGHCRGEGPHVRGCWVVDLVLGKE